MHAITTQSIPFAAGQRLRAWRAFSTGRPVGNPQLTWTKLISDHVKTGQAGQAREALILYTKMREEGIIPNNYTFLAALKACSTIADLRTGKEIHGHVIKSRHEIDLYVASTLIDMYAKCGSIEEARIVFENMRHRDVVSWNTIIIGYAHMEMGTWALQLYSRMQQEGFTPDARTFIGALQACGSLAVQVEAKGSDSKLGKQYYLEQGKAIHVEIAKRGFAYNIYLANTLVDMYGKCGSIHDACGVFENMRNRNVVSWNGMITVYVHLHMADSALQLYARMLNEGIAPDSCTFIAVLKACSSVAAQQEGIGVDGKLLKKSHLEQGRAIHAELAKRGLEPEISIANSLVDMYAKCGSIEDAHQVFGKLKCKDVVSWTAMIIGYTQMDMGGSALELYTSMRSEGILPDDVTFISALKACASLASLEAGKEIHSQIHRAGFENALNVASCLIDMYSKCGSMMEAQQFFDSLLVRDSVMWGALIAGYSGLGDGESVFCLYKRMEEEGIKPDSITFLSILSVCSYNGLLNMGQMYFRSLPLEHEISLSSPHYMCMADLLGRAGQLDDAVAMIKQMPFRPDSVTWMTILGACRKWNSVEVGRNVFGCIMMLDEKFASAYALMINIYVSAGMWEKSSEIHEMRKAWAWKKPGQCRWTDGAGIVHTFLMGDRSHPQMKEIYLKLHHLSFKMRGESGLDSLSLPISDDGKEDVLCGHSERLAVACALINTLPGTPVRIVKNSYVCTACHNAIALISKMEQRTIICRDASSFHVLKEGKCSCGDVCYAVSF